MTLPDPAQITYRMLHEDAAGMPLTLLFFLISGIAPDAPVACNCRFDEGHEPTCDIVAAHNLRNGISQRKDQPAAPTPEAP